MMFVSFNGFSHLSRLVFQADWRKRVISFLVFVLFFFLLFLLYNHLVVQDVAGENPEETMARMGIYGYFKILMALSFVSLFVGYSSAHSLMFYRKNISSDNFLQGSPLARYILIIIRSLLLVSIESVLAFAVADLLQWAFTGNFPVDYYADIDWQTVSNHGILPAGINSLLRRGIAVFVFFILFNSAWFMFCATTFNRHPFLLGLIILWSVEQFVSIIVFLLADLSSEFLQWADGRYSSLDNADLLGKMCYFCDWLISILVVASIVFWIISYSRLKQINLC